MNEKRWDQLTQFDDGDLVSITATIRGFVIDDGWLIGPSGDLLNQDDLNEFETVAIEVIK